MTLEEQYIILMDAAGRVSDEWCREKFIQEADNVLIYINAQVLKNRQDFNALSVYCGSISSSEIPLLQDRFLTACADLSVYRLAIAWKTRAAKNDQSTVLAKRCSKASRRDVLLISRSRGKPLR